MISAVAGAALEPRARERLRARVEEALRRARRSGREVLAAVTVPVPVTVDPCAVVLRSRRADDAWFCMEQPSRAGAALAGLGSVWTFPVGGGDRFGAASGAWRDLAGRAVADAVDGPPGSGPVAVGGFAFAPDGGTSPDWAGFGSGVLRAPEVALRRLGDEARLTVSALVAPDETVEDVLARLDARVAELHDGSLPLVDPAPTGRHRIASTLAPEHFESAVARAVERIAAGELDKVVLAREVQVHAPAPYDAGTVFGALRGTFPDCFNVCVGTAQAAFVAASPELLIRREGQRATTMALAGSARRSSDPAVDGHLGQQLFRSAKDRDEHAIVVRRIEQTLRRVAVWVADAPEPVVVRVANIQHLATPIRAQLTRSVGALELAGLLHPTPAIGGEPHDAAVALMAQLEGMDRGWYAGAIGWTDANEDGELCVGVRAGLLRGAVAHLYAGNGIVGASDPAEELAETEVKLQALLPALT